MTKTFNGILHLDCNEMSEKYGDSAQSWRRQARLGKVPAINYRRKWYFNPDRAMQASIIPNVGESVDNNAEEQGAKSDFMSDFE